MAQAAGSAGSAALVEVRVDGEAAITAPALLPPSELLLQWEVARLEQEVHAARAAAAAAQRNAAEAEAITAEQQVSLVLSVPALPLFPHLPARSSGS